MGDPAMDTIMEPVEPVLNQNPCQICDKAFASVDELNAHYESTHQLTQVKLPTFPVKGELSDPPVFENTMPEKSSDHRLTTTHRNDAFLVDQTPTPTHFLATLDDNGIFAQTPFRHLSNADLNLNPFSHAFRKSVSSTSATDAVQRTPLTANAAPTTPNLLNSFLFSALSPSIHFSAATSSAPNAHSGSHGQEMFMMTPGSPFGFVRSPGVLLPVAVANQYLLSTGIPTSPFPSYAVSSDAFPQFAHRSAVQYIPFSYTEAPQVPSAINLSKSAETAHPRAELHVDVPRVSVTPPPVAEESIDKNQQVRELLKQRMDDFHSEASETFSVTSESESVRALRRARPRLETSDPVLADKRARNRIAAEKCRKRRKARHETLEETNRQLRTKFDRLTEKLDELRQTSQSAIEGLQSENRSLRHANNVLRDRLGLAGNALSKLDPLAVAKSANR